MKKTAHHRHYGKIPNMAFVKVVRYFAFFKGIPFLTWKQQAAAFDQYIEIAKKLN